jgi:hypothetical protein
MIDLTEQPKDCTIFPSLSLRSNVILDIFICLRTTISSQVIQGPVATYIKSTIMSKEIDSEASRAKRKFASNKDFFLTKS